MIGAVHIPSRNDKLMQCIGAEQWAEWDMVSISMRLWWGKCRMAGKGCRDKEINVGHGWMLVTCGTGGKTCDF